MNGELEQVKQKLFMFYNGLHCLQSKYSMSSFTPVVLNWRAVTENFYK